jgi:16S rRNA (cytidine1402-2'-O)-methyltransferase
MPGVLYVVATPIGNLEDITYRAVRILGEADLIACEDTRETRKLLDHYSIHKPTISYHEHNEIERAPELAARLLAGDTIALVSDAGMPLVSDPGYRLVRAAIAEGLPVTALPGANAAVTALVLSGLPPAPFLFLGFPPPKSAARRAEFGKLRAAEQAGLSATLIWYEAPHRLAETLADLAQSFGDRPAAVARELTKRFEEVARGTLPELAARYAGETARGEITLLVGPAGAPEPARADLDAELRRAMDGNSLKDAAALVAAATGLPRRIVYARALALAKDMT